MDPFSEVRDQFVKDILGILDPFYSNAITALLFLSYILFMGYMTKFFIQDYKDRKKRKKEHEEYERRMIKYMEDKNKNKK
jgi:hypothetical protein